MFFYILWGKCLFSFFFVHLEIIRTQEWISFGEAPYCEACFFIVYLLRWRTSYLFCHFYSFSHGFPQKICYCSLGTVSKSILAFMKKRLLWGRMNFVYVTLEYLKKYNFFKSLFWHHKQLDFFKLLNWEHVLTELFFLFFLQ